MDSHSFGLIILIVWAQLVHSYLAIPGASEEKKVEPQDAQAMPNPLESMSKFQLGQMNDDRMMMPREGSEKDRQRLEALRMMNPKSFQFQQMGAGGMESANMQQNMANIKQNLGSMMKNMDGFQFTTEATKGEDVAMTTNAPSDEGPVEAGNSTKELKEEVTETTTPAEAEGTMPEESASEGTSEPENPATSAEGTEQAEDIKTETTNDQILPSPSTESILMETAKEPAATTAEESDTILDLLKETRILDLINIPNGLMDCDNEKNLFCSMVTLAKDLSGLQLLKFREMMEKIAEFIRDLQAEARKPIRSSPPRENGQDPDSDLMFDDSDAPKILAHLETVRKTVNNIESLIKLAEEQGQGQGESEGDMQTNNFKGEGEVGGEGEGEGESEVLPTA